jgi:hypothetical protein
MQKLARIIATDLDRNGHSAIYLSEMARVWPDTKTREKKMVQFAESHHWRLRYYKHGFVAIFDKAPPPTTSGRN